MRQWIVAAAGAALLWPASAGAASPTADQMAGRVAQALRESGQLKNYRVGVKYEDGVAWLLGTVTSEEQSAAAERLAAEVEGIETVVNRLEVKAAETPAPKPTPVAEAPLKLATLEEPQLAQPATLPPNPEATPAAPLAAVAPSRGLPMPLRRTANVQANMPQGGQVAPAQYGAAYAGGVPQGYSTAGAQGVSYDSANMPGYAWPSYAAHPNYAAVTYPQQYSPAAWPYIGPFYPYPQVPLGWRKVTLEWDDGWWFLDFSHQESH